MFGFNKRNSNRLTAKLGLEMLESRLVPANFYWDPQSGTNLNSDYAANWLDAQGYRSAATPTNMDTLIFGAELGSMPEHQTQTPGDPPGLPSGSYVNTLDCVLKLVRNSTPGMPGTPSPQEFVPDYFGWIFHYEYANGTVRMQNPSQVKNYEMHGGNLYQVGGNELTVGVQLKWTWGTINTNAAAGVMKFAGGSFGYVEPRDEGTVKTGNTVILESILNGNNPATGSLLQQVQGTVLLTKGEGMQVNNCSTFVMGGLPLLLAAPIPKRKPLEIIKIEYLIVPLENGNTNVEVLPDKSIDIKAGGIVKCVPGKYAEAGYLCEMNNLQVKSKGSVEIGHAVKAEMSEYHQDGANSRLFMFASVYSYPTAIDIRKGNFEIKDGRYSVYSTDKANHGGVQFEDKTFLAEVVTPDRQARFDNATLFLESHDKRPVKLTFRTDVVFVDEVVVKYLSSKESQTVNTLSSVEVTKRFSLVQVVSGKKPQFAMLGDNALGSAHTLFTWTLGDIVANSIDFTDVAEKGFEWDNDMEGKKIKVKKKVAM